MNLNWKIDILIFFTHVIDILLKDFFLLLTLLRDPISNLMFMFEYILQTLIAT